MHAVCFRGAHNFETSLLFLGDALFEDYTVVLMTAVLFYPTPLPISNFLFCLLKPSKKSAAHMRAAVKDDRPLSHIGARRARWPPYFGAF